MPNEQVPPTHSPYEAVKPVHDEDRRKDQMPENWGLVPGYEHVPLGDLDDARNDSGISVADKMTLLYGDNWGYMLNESSQVDIAIIAEILEEDRNPIAEWFFRHGWGRH